MKIMTNRIIILIAIATVIGIGAYAFADRGGYGYRGLGLHGPGYHHRGWYGPGYGSADRLSDSEIAMLNEARRAYLQETEGERREVYEKELALQGEMAKENPDAGKVSAIQNDISQLEGQLKQKSLAYELKMRKAVPGFGKNFYHDDRMLERGYYGRGGYCGW